MLRRRRKQAHYSSLIDLTLIERCNLLPVRELTQNVEGECEGVRYVIAQQDRPRKEQIAQRNSGESKPLRREPMRFRGVVSRTRLGT